MNGGIRKALIGAVHITLKHVDGAEPSAMARIVVRLRLPFLMMFRNEMVNHMACPPEKNPKSQITNSSKLQISISKRLNFM